MTISSKVRRFGKARSFRGTDVTAVTSMLHPAAPRIAGMFPGQAHDQRVAYSGGMAISDPEFLTVAEVAVLLRVAKMTVYRMIHEGALPATRIRRSLRIPAAAVRALLDR